MLFPDNTSVIAFACFFRASVLDRLLLRVLLHFVEFVYVCFSFRSTRCLEPCSNGRGGTVCPCSCAGGCVFCPLFCVQTSLFFFAHYCDPCFCHFNDCFNHRFRGTAFSQLPALDQLQQAQRKHGAATFCGSPFQFAQYLPVG